MKTCRRCSWPLTLATSRGDVHVECLKCFYCETDLTEKDDDDLCRRCADGPSDDEIYGTTTYSAPSALELYNERESL